MSDETVLVDGTTWVIREGNRFRGEGSHPLACRSCGARVLFVTTAKGKTMPIDPNGDSHFATCPQAATWRRG